MTHNTRRARALFFAGAVFLFCFTPSLWAAGRKSKIESVKAEGGENWRAGFDVSDRKKGTYNVIVFAKDRAGNQSQSGPFNIKVDPDLEPPEAQTAYSPELPVNIDNTLDNTPGKAPEIFIYSPMSGETRAGPLVVSGTVSGAAVPKQVALSLNGKPALWIDVDRYGIFRYELAENTQESSGEITPASGAPLTVAVSYDTPEGAKITSPVHTVYRDLYGPVLTIDSHKDGDMITDRPYLSGRAWISLPEPDAPLSKKEQAKYAVRQVLVSFDNGGTFSRASGGEKWKFRLETGSLPLGTLPVLVKAEFADNSVTTRRLLLTVDTNAPRVSAAAPAENSVHRNEVSVYGTAGDDFELDSVEAVLRPGNKAFYSVPRLIRGLYLDVHALGATRTDVGIGLSFFKDNIRLQFQAGLAPDTFSGENGRVVGTALGGKIIANVFYLPFDYYFGPKWSFYSMSLALGANFTFFSMDTERESMLIGAIIGQWTYANLDMSKIYPDWKYFKNFAFYLEPELWFLSSDISASMVFKMTLGLRTNIF